MPNLPGPVYFVLLLGVLIAVHEFGHFLLAKLLGVKVLRFSIGFGPRLIGFTRGETEYRIAALPLGGYVKMAGEQPFEELSPEEAKRGFLAQAPWKRALIVAAGPLFNLIFPILVFFFVYLGDHKAASTYVGSVEAGMPAAEAGVLPGDRITAVDGDPVKTFEELREAVKDSADRQTQLTVLRGQQVLNLELRPVSGLENTPVEKIRRGYLGVQHVAKPPVVGVPEDSAAAKAGLRTFDRIVKVNGQVVADMPSLEAALTRATGPLTLEVARFEPIAAPGVSAQVPRIFTASIPREGAAQGLSAIGADSADLYVATVLPDGPAAKLGLHPGDRLLTFDGKPIPSAQLLMLWLEEADQRQFTLGYRSAGELKTGSMAQSRVERKDELGNKLFVTVPGFLVGSPRSGENMPEDTVTVHAGPLEALKISFKMVPEIIRETLLVLRGLFTGAVSTQTVGGPIMLYSLASRAAQEGTEYFMRLMALISINLGIMNLLPIPILDGFGLLSALWEGVRRRPIPVKAREVANIVGFAMLVILMIFVFKNDITKALDKDTPTATQRQ